MMNQPTDQSAPTITVPIVVKRHTIDQLRSEASRRGMRADEMASQILANVVIDNLFAAVLDC